MNNSIYMAAQVKQLISACIDLIATEDNSGCDQAFTVVESDPVARIRLAIEALKDAERSLCVGLHEHREGTSTTVFAVPVGTALEEEWFKQYLGDVFEPDEDEFVDIQPVDDVVDVNEIGGATEEIEGTTYHLVAIVGDVEPEIVDEFTSYEELLEHARDERVQRGADDGLYYITIGPDGVGMQAFTGGEMTPLDDCIEHIIDAVREREDLDPAIINHVEHFISEFRTEVLTLLYQEVDGEEVAIEIGGKQLTISECLTALCDAVQGGEPPTMEIEHVRTAVKNHADTLNRLR